MTLEELETDPHPALARLRATEPVAWVEVLGAVAREHALTHDLRGREPRIVHGQPFVVAHRGEREVASRHEPRAERLDPGDRLGLAQPRERRMRVSLELFDGHASRS